MEIITTQSQRRTKTEMALANIFKLPPIPKLLLEASKILDAKTPKSKELVDVISKDQSLVTKVLSIANSPLFGLQRKVTSMDFAILVLGFSELKKIISALSVIETFKNKTDKYLDQKEFWLHSFLTGSLSEKIAEDVGFSVKGEAFLAGFLHDMGIAVIHRFFHSHFVTIYELQQNTELNLLEAETEVLGMNHAEIGSFLAENWNFPPSLCDVIKNHHNPNESTSNFLLASVIHLADFLTMHLKIGNFEPDKNLALDMEAMKNMRIHSEAEMETFISGYEEFLINQSEAIRYLN
ncbi:MAG: HDOD domain-containing protein [Ignavibacteriaceae bacterium]|jgi:putative nucleotidyltransferase with HDIG domain|nr:HDOD domain-containing protein [Ignavibacteriaceae bacterium]